jgi:hypothetical protein
MLSAGLFYFSDQAVDDIVVSQGIRNCDVRVKRVRRPISEYSQLMQDSEVFLWKNPLHSY